MNMNFIKGNSYRAFIFLALVSLGSGQNLFAQTGFLNSRDAYLGQPPPGDVPKVFAPGLLTGSGAFSTNRTAISADGREIYYCTNTSWASNKNLKVKYFKYDGGKWKGPVILNEHLGSPSFSPDNNTLYFCGKPGIILKSSRKSNGWSPPAKYLGRNYMVYDFMTTRSGNKYIGSNGTWGKPSDGDAWKFSVMPPSNADTSIRNLGVPLNSPGFNGDFFVAQDESYMIISTKETNDFACELYISFHKKDNSWTNPKSLGPMINDGVAHRFGQYVSPDGKYLFYTRGAAEKDCAIYWVRFDGLLKKLRKTNFEPYVKHPVKDRTLKKGVEHKLKIPGDTFADDDGINTLKYKATLDNNHPLPDGLTFEPGRLMIKGLPGVRGSYKIKITATDTAKAAAACTFTLNIN